MKTENIELKTLEEFSDEPCLVKLTNEDRRYLKGVRQRLDQKSKFSSINKLEIELEVNSQDKYNIWAENIAGVIQLPSGTRLQINPKIKNTHLIKMWSFVYLNDPINHEDLETILAKGENYFDFLALILHKETQKIFRRGLHKTYIRKRDKNGYLKGKLLVRDQINQIQKNKFNIEYEELSKNNLPNKIILEALSISKGMANSDEIQRELKTDLRQLRKSGVTRTRISEDQLGFETDKETHYYERALNVAKHIIRDSYYENIDVDSLEESISGYSILFNTYDLFESYIRKTLDETLSEDVEQGKQRFLESKKGDPINAEPDLLIGSNLETHYSRYKTKTVQAVGDVKYKKKPNNSNHYQAMAYGVINDVDAFLVYPSSKEKEVRKYKINNSDQRNIEIPFPTSLLDMSDYVGASKDYLRQQLEEEFL
jgi:5-methylcytosine-specific restriction enzyme subunit McrC